MTVNSAPSRGSKAQTAPVKATGGRQAGLEKPRFLKKIF